MSAGIRDDDLVRLREHRHLIAPCVCVDEPAMNEQNGVGAAFVEDGIRHLDVVDWCKTAFIGRRQGGRFGQRLPHGHFDGLRAAWRRNSRRQSERGDSLDIPDIHRSGSISARRLPALNRINSLRANGA